MPGTNLPSRDIDLITLRVRQRLPEIQVKRMQVTWPADDDNVWWFSIPGFDKQITLENADCPFLVDADDNNEILMGKTVAECVAMVSDYLISIKNGCRVELKGDRYW